MMNGVEIKQLRAFFRLIEWIAPKFNAKKNLRNFRKLFKAAADLRDIHVQQVLTRKWAKDMGVFLSEYYNSLKQKELPARKKFVKFAKEFDLEKELGVNEKRIKPALKPLSDDYAAEKIQERIEQQLQQIIEHGSENQNREEHLHQLRIIAKETRYTLDIAQHCFPDLIQGAAELNQHLRGLHQALGKWHDGDVAKAHVNEFQAEFPALFSGTSDELALTGSKVYDKLFRKIHGEKAAYLGVFKRRWRGFLIYIDEQTE